MLLEQLDHTFTGYSAKCVGRDEYGNGRHKEKYRGSGDPHPTARANGVWHEIEGRMCGANQQMCAEASVS